LKKAIIEESVLALPNLNKPFELHTDAFDFAIGGTFMQEVHPISFKSPKLNNTKRWANRARKGDDRGSALSSYLETFLAREEVYHQDQQRRH